MNAKIVLFSLVPISLAAASCGGATPAPGTYTIGFPSVLAAAATDSVQVFVFPYAAADTCQKLVETVVTAQPLPSPVASTAQTSPCSLLTGGADLSVGFGDFAFLAVATRNKFPNASFLVGCATQTTSSTNTVVNIPLELTDFTNPLPTLTCTSLGQRCAQGC